MSDLPIRRASSRATRGSSRAASARSSAYIPEDRSTLLPVPHHPLRGADSRFSLHEQFAATRREYEFGDDDSSSILERNTTASVIEHDKNLTPGLEGDDAPSGARPSRRVRRDFYELLCIPRDDNLSPDTIRQAYYRLYYLLHAVEPPASLRSTAESYFQTVQEAFETLIEPYRRIGYDVSHPAGDGLDDGAVDIDADPPADLVESGPYDQALQDRYLEYYQRKTQNTADLAVRLEATRLLSRHPWPLAGRGRRYLEPLDIAMRHSTTIETPVVSRVLDPALQYLQDGLEKAPQPTERRPRLYCGPSTLTVNGSLQAFRKDAILLVPPLAIDQYTPLGLVSHGRPLFTRILARPFLPHVGLKLRQEFFRRPDSGRPAEAGLEGVRLPAWVVEAETNFSPEPSVITRVGGSIEIPGIEPFCAELSLRTAGPPAAIAPSVGLALYRRLGNGTTFVTVDGGDWATWPNRTCRQFSRFSQLAGGLLPGSDVLLPATVEIGYTFSSYEMGLPAGRAFTRTAERGIRGLDGDMEDDSNGSWTVSAAGSASSAAAYLRYGRSLFCSVTDAQAASLPPGNYSHRSSGMRAEIELTSTARMDYLIALRGLKRLGRFSRLGFELGLTPNTLHLSLYWSRMGQKISIPLLIAGQPSLDSALVFWSTVVPFMSLAALEWFAGNPKAKAKRKSRGIWDQEKLLKAISISRDEADDLTALLAGAVEWRQRAEKEKGGLVVLSAKYGVKDGSSAAAWSVDEVADVTVAVAALVDDGKIFIPKDLRKSRILGFWDPAPTRTKTLFVSYMIGGKQHSVEVRGREELRLP